MTEREVKLPYPDSESALRAVEATGAALLHDARLQRDTLFDTPDGRLRKAGQVLRLRDDGGRGYLTVKGPIERGSMKVREEQETAVDDARVVEAAFRALGLVVGFRYEKYRTEYSLPGVTLTIDDTPVGVFVELEGEEAAILDAARALGRTADEFLLDSYRALFLARQQIFGLPGPDMLFPRA